jgi:hypothetical protein
MIRSVLAARVFGVQSAVRESPAPLRCQHALPRRLGEARLTDLIDDRRFAETIYRVALADGIMDCVTYQDPPEGAS